jgi:hypothetical protein
MQPYRTFMPLFHSQSHADGATTVYYDLVRLRQRLIVGFGSHAKSQCHDMIDVALLQNNKVRCRADICIGCVYQVDP